MGYTSGAVSPQSCSACLVLYGKVEEIVAFSPRYETLLWVCCLCIAFGLGGTFMARGMKSRVFSFLWSVPGN